MADHPDAEIQSLGYILTETLHISSMTAVYRGQRIADEMPVVIKLMRHDYPSLSELTHFRNQYAIAQSLDCPSIIKVLSLEPYRNGYALVMEDDGSISLEQAMDDWSNTNPDSKLPPFSLTTFLTIAVQLAQALDDLYHHHVIHKDIKPQNILIHAETLIVKLTDFSLASRLPRETQELKSLNILEGTLAYLSPEQTGRMNRGIDYRTDFYSLGITFYQLLTQQLPFTTTDPVELVYSHIAKPIPLVSNMNPAVPETLAKIVHKLVAKNAEDRYQSAAGLKYDLERCLEQWQYTGAIAPFEIAQRDVADRFSVPEKIYGRDAEIMALFAAFNRVAKGNTELVLVAGSSGIGKTAVVNEIYRSTVQGSRYGSLRQSSYFIKGKFDQLHRDIPFSAFVQAFQSLMRQLLTEADDRLLEWRIRILSSLGENSQVLIDVIPELEQIIGAQPPVAELSGNAAENRFKRLFQKFLQIFATAEHPLVVFLDDLQWADVASLQLIQLVMSETKQPYLLLIGAYRENEVHETHPLMLSLAAIRRSPTSIHTLTLAPLTQPDVATLVADTLKASVDQVHDLTELIYQKTHGNPFFILQFLKALHDERLIQFNTDTGQWHYDAAQIRTLVQTDDITEFMVEQLQKLPPNTQDALKLGACIGNEFDLTTVAIALEKSQAETAADLWIALQEGFLLPQSNAYTLYHEYFEESLNQVLDHDRNQSPTDLRLYHQVPIYRFVHDRIQQAAYSLISESQKQILHCKIGQRLLRQLSNSNQDSRLFETVNQLNLGHRCLTTQAERDLLIQLNLAAGRKAKMSTAYDIAITYLTTGIDLLAPDSWNTHYQVTFSLYIETAEVFHLKTEFTRSEAVVDIILQHTSNRLDRVKAYDLKIRSFIAQNQMREAIALGLQVLESIGVSLLELSIGMQQPSLPTLDQVNTLPRMTDPTQLAALQILATITSPALNAQPEYLLPIVLTQIDLCATYGYSDLATFAYSWYGMLLCGMLGDIESGYHAGQLAMKLLEQFNAKHLTGQVYNLFNAFIRHWKEHPKTSLLPLLDGAQSALDAGDHLYASYCAADYCSAVFLVEERLELIEQKQRPYINLLRSLKNQLPINYGSVWYQFGLSLQHPLPECGDIGTALMQDEQMIARLQQENDQFSLFSVYLVNGMWAYLFEDYAQAVDHLAIAHQYADSSISWFYFGVYHFYDSLAQIANYQNVDADQQQQYLEQIERNQTLLKSWSAFAPMNYQHRYDLVEAERCRITQHNWAASEQYDAAIASARQQGYLLEEAIANECAAKFYKQQNKRKVAQVYFADAYYGYVRWGAKAKVCDLDNRYPDLLLSTASTPNRSVTTLINSAKSYTSNSEIASETIDLEAVIKASQTLSSEIQFENLLSTLMRVILENAGANRGILVLQNDSQWEVVARCSDPFNLQIENVKQNDSLPANLPHKTSCDLQVLPVESTGLLPMAVINYVKRSRETVIVNDINGNTLFTADPYFTNHRPQSFLCNPILSQGQLIGILYLENTLATGAFSTKRLEVLKLLCSQAAISIKNARFYQQSQAYAQQLEQSLQELKQAQFQLVQSEKMSSLGQLIAGVAHEINNPVNFISGNLAYAKDYVRGLLQLIQAYQQHYPQTEPTIKTLAEAIDLDFVARDLPSLLRSMETGAERIQHIVASLRMFSRMDEAEMKPINIHDGLDSTLMILQSRLKPHPNHDGICVIKTYGDIPLVECHAGQLNQVFMNLISNAIDALEDYPDSSQTTTEAPTIRITTELFDETWVRIYIADNGPGISESTQSQIFNPFFTTKPIGKGTGMGLSISYQIVAERHRGMLECISSPGNGANFVIKLPCNQSVVESDSESVS
jgi:predicted ATPase/signal transduction histidine kinase